MTLLEANQNQELVKNALKKAFRLGQIYWQQADSDSFLQQRKSLITKEAFNSLIATTSKELNT